MMKPQEINLGMTTEGGATGELYSVGDFAAARTLASGDSPQVTITLTVA